ncbi:MAG: response regulator [Thermodesulfobacteriota bacterium]
MRILVVEDEKKVASFIKKGLEEEGYAVDIAYDGIEGEYLAEVNDYDAIILDIMLPKKNGIEVLKSLRSKDIKNPVLLLTARGEVEDKVRGFDSGADDYLTKPFAYEEFLARIKALLRRGKSEDIPTLTYADLSLNPLTRKAKRGEKEFDLTTKEYSLLEYFLRNPERVLTRVLISEHVWDFNFDSFTNIIDVYINHLRSKVDKGFPEKLIHTVRGVGYILRKKE